MEHEIIIVLMVLILLSNTRYGVILGNAVTNVVTSLLHPIKRLINKLLRK